LPSTIKKTLNSTCNGIYQSIEFLKGALATGKWSEVEYAIGHLIGKLLDSSNPEQAFTITSKKRQEREIFVSLGGVVALLKLFRKPFGASDARKISPDSIQRRTELWNELLVILRELCFTVPTLADNIFGEYEISFLFTMLSHKSVFDNAMNLLEEILSTRMDTFSLAAIPNFYSLLNNLSTRQMIHFCRVLSLILFEPEDRQIMEGSHMMRSLDLLQLRRDRMARFNSVVERNQYMVRF
jgi:hypothetical protein